MTLRLLNFSLVFLFSTFDFVKKSIHTALVIQVCFFLWDFCRLSVDHLTEEVMGAKKKLKELEKALKSAPSEVKEMFTAFLKVRSLYRCKARDICSIVSTCFRRGLPIRILTLSIESKHYYSILSPGQTDSQVDASQRKISTCV